MKRTRNAIWSDAVRFIFLDRDGVLVRKLPEGQYVRSHDDLQLLSGAAEAVARLNRNGQTVILVTNQRGVGLGLMTKDELTQLHNEFRKDLAVFGAHLDAIYYCPHDPARQLCLCRKPKRGLFEQAMRDFPEIGSENSVVIGDSLSDIQAALRLGMRSVFIEGEPVYRKPGGQEAAALSDAVAGSLEDAVESLLHVSGKHGRC